MKTKRYYIFLITTIVSIFLALYGYFSLQSSSLSQVQNGTIFVLDVSKSMNVRDTTGGRSRLETSKKIIEETMLQNLGNNFGLVIFAGEAGKVLPLSSDIDLFLTVLGGLGSQNIVKQGTNIESGITSAVELIGDTATNIVVFTDGDDEPINISNTTIQSVQVTNVLVDIVGVGSESGGYIPSDNPRQQYIIRNGQRVVETLQEQELRSLSRSLGASYVWYRDFEANLINLNTGEPRGTWFSILLIIQGIFLYFFIRQKYVS